MKRVLFANFLLFISLISLIFRVAKPSLYLFRSNNAGSIYAIWLSPMYLLILIACVLTLSTLIKKKR